MFHPKFEVESINEIMSVRTLGRLWQISSFWILNDLATTVVLQKAQTQTFAEFHSSKACWVENETPNFSRKSVHITPSFVGDQGNILMEAWLKSLGAWCHWEFRLARWMAAVKCAACFSSCCLPAYRIPGLGNRTGWWLQPSQVVEIKIKILYLKLPPG